MPAHEPNFFRTNSFAKWCNWKLKRMFFLFFSFQISNVCWFERIIDVNWRLSEKTHHFLNRINRRFLYWLILTKKKVWILIERENLNIKFNVRWPIASNSSKRCAIWVNWNIGNSPNRSKNRNHSIITSSSKMFLKTWKFVLKNFVKVLFAGKN